MGKRALVAVLVLVVLAAGGVALLANSKSKSDNSGADNTQQNSTNTQTNTNSQADNQAAAQTNSVTIENYAYTPANITVKVGTTVTWTNKDAVGHTVTVESGEGPDSPLIDQGKTYSYTFTKAGTYNYICTPHPYMKGVVTVTE